MIMLESSCELVVTDSGGVQKEAFFFKKPCIILRTETEWQEIVDAGTGLITDVDGDKIKEAYSYFAAHKDELEFPSIFGDGQAAEFICGKMIEF